MHAVDQRSKPLAAFRYLSSFAAWVWAPELAACSSSWLGTHIGSPVGNSRPTTLIFPEGLGSVPSPMRKILGWVWWKLPTDTFKSPRVFCRLGLQSYKLVMTTCNRKKYVSDACLQNNKNSFNQGTITFLVSWCSTSYSVIKIATRYKMYDQYHLVKSFLAHTYVIVSLLSHRLERSRNKVFLDNFHSIACIMF